MCDVRRADAPRGELETFEVLDLLAQLVDKSLVVAEAARASGGSLRYRFLDTLRDYAAERLAELDHAAAVRAAHARHYVVLAQLAEPHLWGHEQAAWLARLEDDYDNL